MRKESFERSFWNGLKSFGLIIAIPRLIGEYANKYFGLNELYIMIGSAMILWIVYRETIIMDLKKGKRNDK